MQMSDQELVKAIKQGIGSQSGSESEIEDDDEDIESEMN